jgi:hypothetical protein
MGETSEASLDRALREARTAFERFRAEHEQRCRDFAVARRDCAAAYVEVDRVSMENGRLRNFIRSLLPYLSVDDRAAAEHVLAETAP